MATQVVAGSLSALRAASYRLGSASIAQLPHVAASVAQTLRSCRELLSQTPASKQQADGEGGVVLHRLITQIGTLLQARTSAERFAATVLIKAVVEAGGWHMLSKCKHWVTGLLQNLKRPDPSSTRSLIVVTLTRIFMLTWDYPTLVREITTPSLPSFITICCQSLQSGKSTLNEQHIILEALATLLPKHPTIFRTHVVNINRLLEPLFAQPNAGEPANVTMQTHPASLKDAASRLNALLHQCEPKQGSAASWERAFITLVQSAHHLADRVLIGTDEDWQPTAHVTSDKTGLRKMYDRLDFSTHTSALYNDSQALQDCIDRLASLVTTPTNAAVSMPVGVLVDLVTRLFASTIASEFSAHGSAGSVRHTQYVSKEERDAVASVLPDIHVRAMVLLIRVIDRYGHAMLASSQVLLDQICWILSLIHISEPTRPY